MSPIKSITSTLAICLVLGTIIATSTDAKLLRRSRYNDDYDVPTYGPSSGFATGERAILTVRGARHTHDGLAPSKIAIQDSPYRGPFPRGVYDRLDGGRYPMHGGNYPGSLVRPDPYGYNQGSFGGGYGNSFYGAPSRIAVTGAFPYGYGSRF